MKAQHSRQTADRKEQRKLPGLATRPENHRRNGYRHHTSALHMQLVGAKKSAARVCRDKRSQPGKPGTGRNTSDNVKQEQTGEQQLNLHRRGEESQKG